MKRHPFAMADRLASSAAIERLIQTLLDRLTRPLVLLDVGASGKTPAIWRPIARKSMLIGFDPDRREIEADNPDGFLHKHLFDSAVTADAAGGQVTFHLTKSPFCSSTLEPDRPSLSDYLFSDLFEPADPPAQVTAKAITLTQAIERLELKTIDWLKIDTQGTDLRILQSLPAEVLANVTAIDVEPGLMDAYVREDLFIDVHRWLTSRGFWLSNLNVLGSVRCRRSTLDRLKDQGIDLSSRQIADAVAPSPGWCEARYLRRLPTGESSWPESALILAIAALLDGQLGFVLDLAADQPQRCGPTMPWSTIAQTVAVDIRQRAAEAQRQETSLACRLGQIVQRCRKAAVALSPLHEDGR